MTMKGTVALLATVLLIVIAFTTLEQHQAKAQITPSVNFTQLFKQKFAGALAQSDVRVVYQSPTTVILQGDAIVLSYNPAGNSGKVGATPNESAAMSQHPLEINPFRDNQHLWQAVDIVKQHGYVIDSVVTSGLSTAENPLVYDVILSRK